MYEKKLLLPYKRGKENMPDGGGASKTVAEVAYSLWEKAGKPENMSLHFWSEAEKVLKPAADPWVCSICGDRCYYDGRCGDGPIQMCGCRGEAVRSSEYKPGMV
jgi:hypothetical protein